MNIIGQIVVHKNLGRGIICSYKENSKQKYIQVSFLDSDKEIKFVYPDAFRDFLEAENEELILEVNSKLEEKAYDNEIKVRNQELEKEKEDRYFVKIDKDDSLTAKRGRGRNSVIKKDSSKSRKISSSNNGANLAFKLNYCDGGKNEKIIGFNGICSDEIIENNIAKEKRVWCTQPDCDCFKYYSGLINRNELNSYSWVCYEGQILNQWKCGAGLNHSEKKKGIPKKIKRAKENKLCFLTTREPQSMEEDRFIFGVFLIDEVFQGEEVEGCQEGYVKCNSKYRLNLSEAEAKKMLFWDYHENNNGKIGWSSGLFRYIEDDEALRILKDIVKVKENTDDEKLAKEFLKYFCDVNKIN